jgi:hypothetical protein
MLVTVLLRSDGAPTPEADSSLLQLLTDFRTQLVRKHPAVADPTLARYYTAAVADARQADQLAAALRAHPAVEAAFVKPPEALP